MDKQSEKSYRILIIDDNPDEIKLLEKYLKKEKHGLCTAMTGLDALESLKENTFDLILLDIFMTGIDGFETCKRIKELPGVQDVPIIFLTVQSEQKDIAKGFRLGAVDYITKPYNSAELLARVNTHLELKRSRDIILEKNEDLSKRTLS
ncbi:MAG: response regulator [Candidatus Anammoxibacter sp.]